MAYGIDLKRVASSGNPASTHDRLWNDANGTLYLRDSNGVQNQLSPPSSSGMTSFIMSDGSNNQTIENGNTQTFASGVAINGTVAATDTVTHNWDLTKLSSAVGTLTSADYLGIYDLSGVAHQRIAIADLPTISTIDSTNDLFPVLDATDNRIKMVAGDNLPGGSSTALLNTADGRLTLTTATPVTTSNITAATTIYYTPYVGNLIALFDGTDWQNHEFTERSLAIPATTNTNYDIFIYDNAGTITLEAVAWTNDTTRATALVRQDGVYVKTGETNKRYIGSFRTTAVSGQCEDGVEKRFVWNAYNRVLREGRSKNSNTGITYATAAWRELNNGTGQQRFQFFLGLAEDALQLGAYFNSSTTGGAFIAIGIDAVDGSVQLCPTAWSSGEIVGVQGGDITMTGVSVGYHFGTIIEYAASSTLTNSGGDSTLAKFGVWM